MSAILAFLGIGVFALPARDLAAAFSEEMRARHWGAEDFSSRTFLANVPAEDDISTAVDAPALAEVEAAADLMQLCVAAAKRKFGDEFESEEVVRDLAISLFQETSKTLRSAPQPSASESPQPSTQSLSTDPQSYN